MRRLWGFSALIQTGLGRYTSAKVGERAWVGLAWTACAWPYSVSGDAQFSTLRTGMRMNPRTFEVMRVAPTDRTLAPIQRSLVPVIWQVRARWARNSPKC